MNDATKDIDSKEVQLLVHTLVSNLPISETRLADIRAAMMQDAQLQKLMQLTDQGWPVNLCNEPEADLCIIDNLLLNGDRIVIPSSKREQVLKAIHEGHLGI